MTPRYLWLAALIMRSSADCSSSRHGLTIGTILLQHPNGPARRKVPAQLTAGLERNCGSWPSGRIERGRGGMQFHARRMRETFRMIGAAILPNRVRLSDCACRNSPTDSNVTIIEPIARPLPSWADFGMSLNRHMVTNALVAWLFAVTGPLAILLAVSTKANFEHDQVAAWIFGAYAIPGLLSVATSYLYHQPRGIAW